MSVTLGELSVEQVENLIERAVDRRLRVWLDQVLDALSALSEEETSDLMSAVYVVRYIT
jgi:alpha-D-ribose 1-methylphosphonate 5-triphosphate synthase subunit PhnI